MVLIGILRYFVSKLMFSSQLPIDSKIVKEGPRAVVFDGGDPHQAALIEIQLDELATETATAMTANHLDYASLVARIVVSNLHKNTKKSFSETIKDMYYHFNKRSGQKAPLVADDVYEIIMKNAELLDSEIIYDRDFDYDYFGFKTLERSYLLKMEGKVVERPHHMLMRVSVGIHKDDIESVLKTYHLMSQHWFTHASPTLFNVGTPRPQSSSTNLFGGIGVSVHNIRATSSYIRGTNGTSNGIVPMLKVFNNTARYVDQGGGKRKGAFAMYLEPWHADVFEFLDLRKNHGKVYYWKNNELGIYFMLYRFLTCLCRESKEMDSGLCFVLMRLQVWLIVGVRSLRTCTSSMRELPIEKLLMRNLASIALLQYVREKVTALVTTNLNKIIDVNYYPVDTAKTSNLRHRPNGLGVQGLVDAFIMLCMSFDSPEAQQLNKDIFETIYYHALKASS
ncbi:hypothetical protein IFM89_033913 [Coptis chinensis]|uniref:Ribonucleoside-diphosphate reductase n=1 Tax=Coptis chinensis TaxID=261450 RepID=A0A835HUQ5_9MAGN|nr:hypothetical protein IFM89_033913 [Coptis chinensis]